MQPDANGILCIRPSCIRSPLSIWADIPNLELGRDDWQLKPQIFSYVESV
jgi:hypothetical protein